MAYRGEDAGEPLEAPTAEGVLRLETGPRLVKLSVGRRTLQIAERFVTLVDHKKSESLEIAGLLVVSRDVPHEDLGIWLELLGPGGPGMRRIFGVEPASLLEAKGLTSLKRLDTLAHHLRSALDRFGPVRRGFEIGRSLDKVLVADLGDRHVVYARRLFRDRARFALAIHDDGRIAVAAGKELREVHVTSRFGVTVVGDYIRFADPEGVDLAKVAVPWIGHEYRNELARRIGLLVDRSAPTADREGP